MKAKGQSPISLEQGEKLARELKYEKVPLLVGDDLLLSLQLEFDVQRDQANAQYAARNLNNNSKPSDKPMPNMKSPTSKEKTDNPKSDRKTSSNSSEFNNCSISTPDLQESVEVQHMKKPELINKLRSLNINFNINRSPSDLRIPLKQYLEKNHQVHVILKAMPLTELKNMASKVHLVTNYRIMHVHLKSKLAQFFFKNYPVTPLSTLKKYMNNEVPVEEKKQLDKQDPIFLFLKNASNSEISDWTKQLGRFQ